MQKARVEREEKPGKRAGTEKRPRSQANATELNSGGKPGEERCQKEVKPTRSSPVAYPQPPQTPRSRPGGGKKRRGTLRWRRGSGARRIPTRLATDRGQPGGPPVVCSAAFSQRAAVSSRKPPADKCGIKPVLPGPGRKRFQAEYLSLPRPESVSAPGQRTRPARAREPSLKRPESVSTPGQRANPEEARAPHWQRSSPSQGTPATAAPPAPAPATGCGYPRASPRWSRRSARACAWYRCTGCRRPAGCPGTPARSPSVH